jgi:uncharacterized protein (DUF302 family)
MSLDLGPPIGKRKTNRIIESSDARRIVPADRRFPCDDEAGVAMAFDGSEDPDMSNQRAGPGHELVVTKLSPWSMADTESRLAAVLAARGMKVFAVIDHSDEAAKVGLALRSTKSLIIGNQSSSARVIAVAPLAALDLPVRVVIWEDGYQTKVSYPSPADLARRYRLEGDLAATLESIDAVISVVVDR